MWHGGKVAASSDSADGKTQPMTVAELDRKLKRAVEGASDNVWVEGEVGSLKAAASGHLYFSLKDEREDASIDCVMYRAAAIRGRRVLSDGARVQVRGKGTLWAPRGKLQFVCEAAKSTGRGALLEALEQLKLRLAEEGLFNPQRKRPLPREIRVIGVVTSASGAAIHDIVQVAFRRGSARILLAPATVQGESAPGEIVEAIARLEEVSEVDVIIVGRGGGAADELSAFNDESVVRRVASCRVPVVSAVGHEIDMTLTDMVADLRAATPSQAAEMVVPETAHRARQLSELSQRLGRAMRGRLLEDRMAQERLHRRLGDPKAMLGEKQQLLDDLSVRLTSQHPQARLEQGRGRLAELRARLASSTEKRLLSRRGQLEVLAARLGEMSPLAVLARGYAIALGRDGKAVRRASELLPGDLLKVRLHEGEVEAEVLSVLRGAR